MTAEKIDAWSWNLSRPPSALNNHRHKYKETSSLLIPYCTVVLSFIAIVRYFRNIVAVHDDGHMACTPHILHPYRTPLRPV